MLRLPDEYTGALEEVLKQPLSGEALKTNKLYLRKVSETVAEMSHGLTREREAFIQSRYLNDPKLQQAYLTYYTTTNLLKIWPPLRELARSGFFEGREVLKHLDLGTGTGAAVWGLATYLRHEEPAVRSLSTTFTDALEKNLTAVGRFAEVFSKRIAPLAFESRYAIWDLKFPPRAEIARTKFDLITLMNVVNELGEERDEALIAELKSLLAEGGAIVMIEPSTREQSRRALRFRDRMVEAGWHVYAPCTRTDGCPALRHPDDWCHTEVHWERPSFIKAIDDLTGTLRLSLKYTYAVFLGRDSNFSDILQSKRDFYRAGRVVSELFDEKGRVRLFICNERGRLEHVLNKRDKTDRNRDTYDTERYDVIAIEHEEIRRHDVKLTSETDFHIMNRADGCGYVNKSG